MKNAITIDQLREYAERLPARRERDRHAPYYTLAVYDQKLPTHFDPSMSGHLASPMEATTVTFTWREAKIDGVPVTAWYYKDVLVKVAV